MKFPFSQTFAKMEPSIRMDLRWPGLGWNLVVLCWAKLGLQTIWLGHNLAGMGGG